MAGMMYRTTQLIQSSSRSNSLCLSSSLILYRHRSNKSGTSKFAQLIEVDLASSDSSSSSSSSATSSSSTADDNMAATGVRKLEDVIYNIIVRRSAPDWLPFLPGSSYWVPPRRRSRGAAGSLVDIIGNLSSLSSVGGGSMRTHDEETLSMSSVRGWPSSSFFIHGSSPARPLPVDVQVVEVKFQEESENESQSEDDSDH